MYKNYHIVDIDHFDTRKPIPNEISTTWKRLEETETYVILCTKYPSSYMMRLINALCLMTVAFVSDEGKYAQIGESNPPLFFRYFPHAQNNNPELFTVV